MSQRNFLTHIAFLFAAILLLRDAFTMPSPTRAQSPAPHFFQLTTINGLSHDIVYAIVQDHQGFLWFGTQDGLNRYDGYTFTVFRHLRSDPHSPIHNTIQALTVDSTGALWVGTVGGLDRYDRDSGGFIHYTEIAESVTVIYEDGAGTLWVGTAGSGLWYYDRPADRFVPYENSLPDNHILALHGDPDGTLWVGTEYAGLWNNLTGHLDSAPYTRITAIIQDRAGALWVGSGALHEPAVGGLVALDPTTGQAASDHQRVNQVHVTALLEDRTGTLWVGTENGLATLDRNTGEVRLRFYHHDPLDPYSPVNDHIYALYEDHAGILWIATDEGISRYVREKNRFVLYRHDPQNPDSLGAPRVGAVLKDRDGALWIGLHNGGLDRIDATGTVVHYRNDPAVPYSLSHDHVTALYQDHTGDIWIGTSAGLDRLGSATGEGEPHPYFTHYVHDPADPHSLGPGAVKVIYVDRSGALWIGTEEPGTLSRLEPGEDKGEGKPHPYITVYRYDPAHPDAFPNTYGIRAILEDQAGHLWLGTYNGLVCFDPQNGTFIQYRHDPENPHSLSDDFVWALYATPDDTLWVGTHGGLNRLDKINGQFTVYTIEDGLPNDGIAAILGDSAGRPYLWLATMGGGLSRFDPRTATFHNYDIGDGLQGMHFIPGAAYRSPDGELFFGGSNGLNRFYPAAILENSHVPPVVLTAFRKFDRKVDFGRDLADVREITLTYRENFFSFEFAALDYADPAKNQYAYILEGFDRDWVLCGTRHYAAYTNVPPGRYTFRVRGSNNDGIWNQEGLAVQVIITPPFWATWWFKGLITTVVVGIGAAIYAARARNVAALREREERFRTLFENAPLGVFEVDMAQSPPRILRANQAASRIYERTAAELNDMSLEQLVADKTQADLQRLLDGLRDDKTVTLESTHRRRDGSEFPARMSATRQQASRHRQTAIVIVEDITAEKAWRSEEEAIAEERRRIAREIHDGLAQDLAALRLQVRRWQALVESDPAHARIELDRLHDFLGEKIREVRRAIFALRPVALEELGFWNALRRFLNEFGEQNQLHVYLEVTGAEENLPASLEPVLFRIVQEALNNVAKHARARMVWVELTLTDGVHLRVRDDGVGCDPATLPEMVRRGHVGLRQMRERVEALGGTLTIHSQPGQGMEIGVDF
ncbi:MAG TPA: two-component regulator propeller domain-containing protein [Anaerolineae bacterium]|nr:two-component regulator propeller domain-containing protein [Anaerolineae bacterium]